jgi:hypothetical protein
MRRPMHVALGYEEVSEKRKQWWKQTTKTTSAFYAHCRMSVPDPERNDRTLVRGKLVVLIEVPVTCCLGS